MTNKLTNFIQFDSDDIANAKGTGRISTLTHDIEISAVPFHSNNAKGVGSGWGRNDTLSRCFLGPEIFAGQ